MRRLGVVILLIGIAITMSAQKWKADPPQQGQGQGQPPPPLLPIPQDSKVVSDGNYCIVWVPVTWAQNGTAEGIAPNGLHVQVRAEKTSWDAMVERFKAQNRRLSKAGGNNLQQESGFLLLEVPGKEFRFKAARPATDPDYVCTAEAWGGNSREDAKALASRIQGSGRVGPNEDNAR